MPALTPAQLHQLLPPVLTCIVAKVLGESPREDHWALRALAARVAADICGKFGQHKNMQVRRRPRDDDWSRKQIRLTRTLIGALLDGHKSLATHFGAVTCLHALGPAVVDAVLLEQLPLYSKYLEPMLAHHSPHAADAQRVEDAVVVGAACHVPWPLMTAQAAVVAALQHKAGAAFGVPAPSQYAALFGGFAAKVQQRMAAL